MPRGLGQRGRIFMRNQHGVSPARFRARRPLAVPLHRFLQCLSDGPVRPCSHQSPEPVDVSLQHTERPHRRHIGRARGLTPRSPVANDRLSLDTARTRRRPGASTDHGPPPPPHPPATKPRPARWHSRARSASLSSHAWRMTSCWAGVSEQACRTPPTRSPARIAEKASRALVTQSPDAPAVGATGGSSSLGPSRSSD
jgi:hypothetical protein